MGGLVRPPALAPIIGPVRCAFGKPNAGWKRGHLGRHADNDPMDPRPLRRVGIWSVGILDRIPTLLVSGGGAVQASGGGISAPSHVNSIGMLLPKPKAGEMTRNENG